MSDSPTFADATTVDFRALLAQVRRENEADLAGAQETLARVAEDGSEETINLTDATTAARHMIADAEQILAEIAAAEQRLAAGTYGQCERCGQRIPDARLELRPYVRTCVTCAG